MKNNRFAPGSGCYKCECCKRLTRKTGDGAESGMCEDCFEMAGIFNAFCDEGLEGIRPYASEVVERVNQITAKGGKIDGDFQRLMLAAQSIIEQPKPYGAHYGDNAICELPDGHTKGHSN